MEIDELAIDADLRDRVGHIDLERNDAAALVWSRFLEHARRPLNFGEHFSDDHGNDQVSFVAARTPNGDGWTVELERRVGVVRDDDYEGTIISTCKMRVADGPAWAGVDDRYWAEEEDGARGGVDAMQAAAETSSAFAAWIASPLRELRVYAAYG